MIMLHYSLSLLLSKIMLTLLTMLLEAFYTMRWNTAMLLPNHLAGERGINLFDVFYETFVKYAINAKPGVFYGSTLMYDPQEHYMKS